MAKCPYCKKNLHSLPKRRTKCPHCGQFILVRHGELLTVEQTVRETGSAQGLPTDLASDAERILAIRELETAVASKQPALNAARVARDEAKQRDLEARRRVSDNLIQQKGLTHGVLLRSRAVYNAGEELDRGELVLGKDNLRFLGWHGKLEILLESVTSTDLGESELPHRAGVPILQRIWPGHSRGGWTLILGVEGTDSGQHELAVFADLRDGTAWRESIVEQRERLADLAAERSDLMDQQVELEATAGTTGSDLESAKAAFDAIQQEVHKLERRKNSIRSKQRQVESARKRAARKQQAAAKGKKR